MRIKVFWEKNSGACEGKSGRTMNKSDKNRNFKMKSEQDLLFLMGFGWIRKWGSEIGIGSAIDEKGWAFFFGWEGFGVKWKNEEKWRLCGEGKKCNIVGAKMEDKMFKIIVVGW